MYLQGNHEKSSEKKLKETKDKFQKIKIDYVEKENSHSWQQTFRSKLKYTGIQNVELVNNENIVEFSHKKE